MKRSLENTTGAASLVFYSQEAKMLACYNRADDGLRTRDLQLGKLALYQLSYVRVSWNSSTPDVALSLL